jgi:Nuclear pore complex component
MDNARKRDCSALHMAMARLTVSSVRLPLFLPSSQANLLSSPSLTSWPHWPLIEWCFTGVYLYNIYRAGRPAFKPADNAADVDLTAGQRALLGLDPNATPPETPSTKYITPPRYARSAGSSASGASRGSPASYGSISSSRGGSFGSSRAVSLGSAWSSPRSVSGSSLLVADSGAGGGAGGTVGVVAGSLVGGVVGGAAGSGSRVGGSLLHRLHERRRSSLSYSRQSPINVPTYGDPDAWLDSISGTPPRREEWRFVPNEPLGVSTGSAGSTAIPASRPALKHSSSYSQSYSTSYSQSYSQPYSNTNSSSKALLPYASGAASGRSSPLGLSLEGTGLWNSTGSGGAGKGSGSGSGSVFRPDTPSPIGTRPAAVGVPLTSRWVYERGREEGRF